MKNYPGLFLLLFIAMLSLGCLGIQDQNTVSIELEGNPTTGYTWVYTMSPEGIVREISNKYVPDKNDGNLVGSGGKFIFTFEAVREGEAELVFSYLRTWEEGIPALKTVTYRAIADAKNNLVMTQK